MKRNLSLIRQREQRVSVKNMWGRPATSPRTAFSLASKISLFDSLSCYPVQCAALPLSDYLLRLFRWSLRRRVPQIFLPAPRCPLCRLRCNRYLFSYLFFFYAATYNVLPKSVRYGIPVPVISRRLLNKKI